MPGFFDFERIKRREKGERYGQHPYGTMALSISRQEVKRVKQVKYRPGFCKKMLEYFAQPPQRMEKKTAYYPDGTVKSEEPIVVPTPLPTFQSFAQSIGVPVETLETWRSEHPDFDSAYEQARQMQENIWLVNSLTGKYNSSFAQFFGKTVLGHDGKTDERQPDVITVRVVE